MKTPIAAVLVAVMLAGGCATKHYGRLEAATAEADCAQVAAGSPTFTASATKSSGAAPSVRKTCWRSCSISASAT